MFKTNNNEKYFIFYKAELLPAGEYDDFKNFLRSSDSKSLTGTTSIKVRY